MTEKQEAAALDIAYSYRDERFGLPVGCRRTNGRRLSVVQLQCGCGTWLTAASADALHAAKQEHHRYIRGLNGD